MKKQRLPTGWSHKRIRELINYYDNQTEEQQAAEIESALNKKGQTVLVVPTKLVPEILELVRKKRGA
jgi:hypothetical protein